MGLSGNGGTLQPRAPMGASLAFAMAAATSSDTCDTSEPTNDQPYSAWPSIG